jgi:hypothetical protein
MGYNYRMTNLEAALGLAQMERIGIFLERKRSFARIYREVLAGLPEVEFQKELPGHRAHGGFRHSPFPAVEFRNSRKNFGKKACPPEALFSFAHIPIPERLLQVFLSSGRTHLRGGHQSSRFHGQRRRIHPPGGRDYP